MSKKQKEPEQADVNIAALAQELRRGFMVFRAFERGMEVADQLVNIENNIQDRLRRLKALDKKLDDAETEHLKKIDALSDELALAIEDLNKQIEVSKAQANKELAPLLDNIAGKKTELAKLSKQIENKQAHVAEIEEKIAARIEEEKTLAVKINTMRNQLKTFLED